MIWKFVATERPESGWYLCRHIYSLQQMPLKISPFVICDVAGKTYDELEIEWLDISIQLFTSEDLEDAWYCGFNSGKKDYGTFEQYLSIKRPDFKG